MIITQDLRKIGGTINSTDLNYNFDRIIEDLQLAVEGVVFKDGYTIAKTIKERNSYPKEVLVQGLWVAVSETGIIYEYNKKNDVRISDTIRYFGINEGDLPDIPYRIDGDPSSGILLNACYVCNADSKDSNWSYTSVTTGLNYNDGDWAVYKKEDFSETGYWIRVPKWIPIINATSILENSLTGPLEDLKTENKTNLVSAINEIHDDLGTLDELTTDEKSSAVFAINELDNRIGELNNLKTSNKNNIVSSINEVDNNVGPIENLTTNNKGNVIVAINELDSENGNLNELETNSKDNFVNSINEIHRELGDINTLTTDNKTNTVDAINELDLEIGELSLLTTKNKDNVVNSINEIDSDVGSIENLTTNNKTNTVSAINELKSITDALRGATIIIGKINLDTAEVTDELLTQRALEIMGGESLQTGWTLVDNEQHEWHYNGENWQDLEQPNIYPAQNGTLGTVRGNLNGDISIIDGNMTVLHSQNSSQLNGQDHTYYATKEYADTKADKVNVLELNNTIPYEPTEDYHPTTKKYVDTLSSGAIWGNIMNNIEDQEDLMILLNNRPTKSDVLTLDNAVPYTPTENYHPATKTYVDNVFLENNTWGKISGDIKDQQDLQNELVNKQNKDTAWNTDNLIVDTLEPAVPAQGYIIWIDLNS